MRLLLDTHLLLWSLTEPERLSATARALIGDPTHRPVFSIASIWELVQKRTRPRQELVPEPGYFRATLIQSGYQELPIRAEHVLAIADLPLLHKDPFDRVLLGQAIAEGMLLVTADDMLRRYPGPIRAV